ncbi:DUF3096 domain-containing protein [Thiorhodovibrio frisius]|uniref:DUF3096 domain-containing protein n=1 Tax=Thiorhodovibrio frisius TaxID=631362 RepID=H8Z3G5_9GAMM|nr:Protein of unknown function (DUF3096) [Thiorhodovibrio frisius]WPL24162.1 hypothetical protein Thiofri_04376 [Thiorhodovibrio frisius]
MNLSFLNQWPIEAALAILAGVLILLLPRLLHVMVAAYLIAIGILGLVAFFYGAALPLKAIIALVAGFLVLLRPAVLSYVVGIYLIVVGLLESGLIRF